MKFTTDNLERILSMNYDKAITSHLAEVVAFYAYIFNDPGACAGCPGKVKAYWRKLQKSGLTTLKSKIMSKNQSKFKIKEGVAYLQMDFGSSTMFSNNTITDELAVEYLSKNPNRISNFAVYPENWKSLAGIEASDEGEDIIQLFDKELSIEDAIEAFGKSEIKTSAKTADGLVKAFEKASDEQKISLKNIVEASDEGEDQ